MYGLPPRQVQYRPAGERCDSQRTLHAKASVVAACVMGSGEARETGSASRASAREQVRARGRRRRMPASGRLVPSLILPPARSRASRSYATRSYATTCHYEPHDSNHPPFGVPPSPTTSLSTAEATDDQAILEVITGVYANRPQGRQCPTL
ncbi:hypothetical protein BD626DRAFT_508725 [Schizophyllum amplum]|uniref:Uncharacterized protein n=1 Tax=Schizophyllum amplum TaxID=97359 RepID=A0A550C391_9AGAR|nr:hypothetical protein BD626DRAFT_508725 [Auriculariopsis ampla]